MKRTRERLLIFALCVMITTPALSEYGATKAGGGDPRSASQERSTKLVTPRGTIRIGMSEETLNDILGKQNRKFIPSYILNKGWLIYRDITSNNPNDTITFYTTYGRVSGWDRNYVPSPQNKGSRYEYEYKERDRIDKWFFPSGKARWNGSELNILDWNKLIGLQKVMFIIEYVKQLNEEQKTNITVDVNKYVLSMDHYASTFPKQAEKVTATKGVDSLLISDGKAYALPVSEAKSLEFQ